MGGGEGGGEGGEGRGEGGGGWPTPVKHIRPSLEESANGFGIVGACPPPARGRARSGVVGEEGGGGA